MLRTTLDIPQNTHKKSIFAIACSKGWPLPFGMGKLKKFSTIMLFLNQGGIPLKNVHAQLVRAQKKAASSLLEALFFRCALKAGADAQRSVRPASFLQLFACRPTAALAPRKARPDTPQLWHGTRCSICLNTQKPPE